MWIAQPAHGRRGHHSRVVLPFGWEVGSLRQYPVRHTAYGDTMCHFGLMQSGAGLFAFVALLLLAFPDVLTFHVLFALPRFAERSRTF